MVITALLKFLGLGAPQGYADWGSILSYSRDWIIRGTNPTQYWFTILYPECHDTFCYWMEPFG